jgi:hypothetical protein
MKCACQKPPAACASTPGGSPGHIKKTMHFYPGDFDAFCAAVGILPNIARPNAFEARSGDTPKLEKKFPTSITPAP